MKLSSLISKAEDALELYGDLDINVYYAPGGNWFPIYDYEGVIYYDKKENELLLSVG